MVEYVCCIGVRNQGLPKAKQQKFACFSSKKRDFSLETRYFDYTRKINAISSDFYPGEQIYFNMGLSSIKNGGLENRRRCFV